MIENKFNKKPIYFVFQTKLIKLFSKQLVAKSKLAAEDNEKHLGEYPKTEQWLMIVGLKNYISVSRAMI